MILLETVYYVEKLVAKADGIALHHEYNSVESISHNKYRASVDRQIEFLDKSFGNLVVRVNASDYGIWKSGECLKIHLVGSCLICVKKDDWTAPLFEFGFYGCDIAECMIGRLAVGSNQTKYIIAATCSGKQRLFLIRSEALKEPITSISSVL